MATFSVLLKCVPFFAFAGMGLYILLGGLVPSWRTKGWRHWKVYGTDQPIEPDSWLVSLGWAKPTKPLAEGDFSPKTAVWVQGCAGALFLVIGLAGIVWIVLNQIKD